MKNWIKLRSNDLLSPLQPFETNEHTVDSRRSNQRQVIEEFRSKMHQAEELVSKLAFNLREIQEAWSKSRY